MKQTMRMGALVAAMMASSMQVSAAEDPYVQGFKAYANELKSHGSSHLAPATQGYAQDVKTTLKKAGYIGPELPLPQAVQVTDGVYTIVGSQIWHNPSNFGLNNNISFIVFDDGVFVFNAGANTAIAYSVHRQIQRITSKPVKWVAVENNQGHAYLGASYWVDVGVKNLYSSDMANFQFDQAFNAIKAEWAMRVGTAITEPSRNVSGQFTTFESRLSIDVGGGETVELIDFGPGHTPASTSAYVPSRKVLLTGDLGFNERMPVMFPYTNSADWVTSFKRMLDEIPGDAHVIPGHGTPTDMETVTTQTLDYFVYLRNQVKKVIDQGGNEDDAEQIDQSMYEDRPVFDQAAKNNARRIYREMTGGDFDSF
ncbi:MBL fold metallo-hydrolase [Thiomicrospira sp. WB1]|uniref:MBL fold metallo-hydrolase n=1 Tax=Thiomicrospira sp. WB1 TaxID=1685380 RepID=UPI00074732AB|nr:MBL fold metallo-hydrolase [Thiomicrospira sp. WB1]KUJ71453.1 MBL fold metallo-hydrolase [Thiomicrospira sp. WB1]